MSDDEQEEEEDEPIVELGERVEVDGVPLAQVASRLAYPQQQSEVSRKEGETVVRTPDGPKRVDELLEEVENPYFQRRQEFVNAVREVTGTGPVPTSE
jgi:hypothetical protein